MRALISFRRGAELAYGRGFHIGVAPSWHPDADFTLSGAQLECGRGFYCNVAPS